MSDEAKLAMIMNAAALMISQGWDFQDAVDRAFRLYDTVLMRHMEDA